MSSLNQMLVAVFCLLLLAGHAQASSYGYNCVVDGTLSVAGKSIRPLANGTGVILIDNGSTITVSSTYALTNASSGGVSLLAGSSPSQSILGLKSGTGISLSSDGSDVTIANTYALTNASSGGVSLLAGSSPSQRILGLKSGTGITLASDGSDVTITSTSSGVNLTSAGGTFSLVNNAVGPALAIKGLTAGSGVRISSTSTDLTISSDVNLTSAGGTNPLVSVSVGPALSILGLTAGNGISLSSSPTAVTIASTTSMNFVKANIALAAGTTTDVFSFTPATNTNYGIVVTFFATLPGSGNNAFSVIGLAQGTGSSSAGTIGCGVFARIGGQTLGTQFASAAFNINSAQTLGQINNANSAGVFLVNCYLTTSGNSFPSFKIQVQGSAASTLFTGSSMAVTTNPPTN